MNFALKTSLALVVGLATLAACKSSSNNGNGDDDDSSGGGLDIDSDLAEKDFADLEEEDKVALCKALNKARASASEANAEKSCALAGALAGGEDGDEDACTEAKEKCEEDGVEAPEDIDCDAYAEADFSDCEGSVQDLIDCFNDQASASSDVEIPACDELGDAEKIEIETPKSCTALAKSCAAALGGGGGTTTPGDDDDKPSGDDDDDTPTTPTKDSGPPTATGCMKCAGTVTCTATGGSFTGTLSGTNSECKVTASSGLPEPVTLKCADKGVYAASVPDGPVGEFTPESATSANFDMTISTQDGDVDITCTQ